MIRNNGLKIGLVTGLLLWVGSAGAQTNAVLIFSDTQPAIKFAAGELKAALEQKKQFTVGTATPSQLAAQAAPIQIIVTTNGAITGQPAVSGLSKEGYAIRRVTTGNITRWWVIGNDAPGAMYAGLELTDSVNIDGSLANINDKQRNPNLAVRGIKFNIPLDARTPSYADDSTVAQANIPEMWSTEFWHAFLDQMARSRLNSLSLWNESPFPSLVVTPGYENASITDVKRKIGAIEEGYKTSWQLETVKTMTMEQKVAFWREVMQYANDRGIDISLFTWNLFVYGTEGSGYGLTNSTSNKATKDYIRKSVRSLFNTYPLLKGIGVTAGESMPGLSNDQEEQWLWDSYGQGFKDAFQDMKDPANASYNPNRQIKFIHRPHYTDLGSILATFKQLPGYTDPDSSLRLTFKYSQAHMYSSTRPLYINGYTNGVPANSKVTLEVRNDSAYNVRWGDPDFAREYLNNIPDRTKIDGFYMGPDGNTLGRDVISKNPDTQRQQFIHKHWYYYMIWGNLAYDPSLPNGRFQDMLGAHYPEVPSGSLYSGLASVSKIFPLVNRFFWGDLDFKWYPEA
jgi:hypothetical protein